MTEPATTETPREPRSPVRVLLVDNERPHAEAMREALERVGYECAMATSGPEGAERAQRERFDIIVTDLVMNEVDGMQVLKTAKEAFEDAQVILVTGHGTIPKAVEAMQQGAFSFLEKPITPAKLRAVVERAADAVRLLRTNLELQQRLDERFGFEGIIYASDKLRTVIERLKRIAPTDAGVLITGESGTGKELVAQALHQNSPRKKFPFVALNCGAVAEHLVESELFGHVKGAFTDALTDRMGKFEYAQGGTLFLDEVGDMPLATQIKLLRVLEERQITRVGDNKPIKVNVRVLSATNRRLEEAIERGTFRADLYYRLKVVTIDLPRLAERPEDVLPLLDHFRRQFARRHGKTAPGVSVPVRERLYHYAWPGNVRQLRNVVENMVVLDIDGVLDVDDLPPELADAPPPAAVPALAAAGSGDGALIGKTMDEIERWAIEQTLRITNGNREEAAKVLGIGVRTLYRKLDKYGKDGEAMSAERETRSGG